MSQIIAFLSCHLVVLVCSYEAKWSEWGSCYLNKNSLDQNCIGLHDRHVIYEDGSRQDQTAWCKLTTRVIDGGYGSWGEWASCSGRCSDKTTRRRTCHNPTPCNGGKDCSEFGRSELKKLCGPVEGQWGQWGAWKACSINTKMEYGTGTKIRYRECNNPAPACGGHTCVGDNFYIGNCRRVPPCLTEDVFNAKFLRNESAMVIYTSAQVDLYLLTKNLCNTTTVTHQFWKLYKVDEVTGIEKVVVALPQYKIKFGFHPGEFGIGLYRLYAKIGYPDKTMPHWMDESMYIRIEQPPPHAFIDGGSGRTVGQGYLNLDARSVSFSLLNGPGDPSGLDFQWKCFNFKTLNIYKLLQFNLEYEMIYKDNVDETTKWYETKYLSYVEDTVAFFYGTEFYNRILQIKSFNKLCIKADNMTVSTIEQYDIPDDGSIGERIVTRPFTYLYDVKYMFEFDEDDLKKKNVDVEPLPRDERLIKNEFLEFMDIVFDSDDIFEDTDIFLEALSESSKSLNTLYEFRTLTGLPEVANETFFNTLNDWMEEANQSSDSIRLLNAALKNLKMLLYQIKAGEDAIHIIGIDQFFLWAIDEDGLCLVDLLADLFDKFLKVDSYDWSLMKEQEINYLYWLENEMLQASECETFTGYVNGTSTLLVRKTDVAAGKGYLVYIRVQYNNSSVSYFVHHVQTVDQKVSLLSIECRFNCMEKTALTAITSLKAYCLQCSDEQQARFWWNIRHFDLDTRLSVDAPDWKTWMLSDVNSNEFVLKANVLNSSAGYLIEVYMEIGQDISMAVWIVSSNTLPYGGSVYVEDGPWGEKKILTMGWMDEGFRSVRNSLYDVKEELNFRIIQTSSDGKETLLYYGWEEENYVTVKPGIPADNYEVILKVQIFDIFIDYAEVSANLGQIMPQYTKSDEASVNSYLTNSENTIDYYWKTGNIKQVAMNAEVAGMSVKELSQPLTIFDTHPSDWRKLGELTIGTNTTKTFDELWDMYLNPDYGDQTTFSSVSQHIEHLIDIMTNATEDVEVTATINVDHMTVGLGTLIQNKNVNNQSSVFKTLHGNTVMLSKLIKLTNAETYPKYEDYSNACEGILRLLSNALENFLPNYSSDSPESLDIYTIMSDIRSRGDLLGYSDADLTAPERAFIASHVAMKNELDIQSQLNTTKEYVEYLLRSIDDFREVLKVLNYRKQLAVDVHSSYIQSLEDKKMINVLLQGGLTDGDGVSVNFDRESYNSNKEQNIQLTSFDHTPFAWDKESKYINSKTVTVTIGDNKTSNSVIPSKIRLPNGNIDSQYVHIPVPDDCEEFTSQLIIHKLFWKNPRDSLIFEIKDALKHLNHTVFINRNGNPTETHDLKMVISPENWITDNYIKIVIKAELYTKPTNVNIGILIENGKNTTNASSSNRRRRSTTTIVYGLAGATVGCRVWDDINDRWDNSSCSVSTLSSINETVCDCSNPPGKSFATTFYVPPNTIDFGSVFQKFDLKDNAAVFATVISLVVLYLLICVWAFKQDKKDHIRWALSYLIDNSVNDEYLYIISVHTGLRRHAGTTSNVQFMIFGGKQGRNKKKSTDTDIRLLDDGSKQGFEVGSVRKFVMSVPKRIRDPTVLKIWHDNNGEGHSASWYLDKIVLEDVQTCERFTFICNRWLSVDHDDGSIECALPAYNEKDTHKFSFLFDEKTKENTTDNHMWLSVAVRPEQSNFSRVERLACCLTLLFLTMITNAMFYGQDTGYRLTVGPISFSLSGIYISIISALIVAPPIFIVTYIFRNSKKRNKIRKTKMFQRLEMIGDMEDTKSSNLPADHDISSLITNTQFPLPFWCRYIAWALLSLAVNASGFFLILYSMEWGKSKSEEWLLCFCMSFFESMFIVDPLKIILLSCVFSLIMKKRGVRCIQYDREKILVETKKRAISPVSLILDMFKTKVSPVNSCKVAKMKEKRKDELNVQESFVELLLYLVLLGVLYLISFNNRDMRWFNVKNHLDQQLVTTRTGSDFTLKLGQVSSASQWYSWLDDTLLPFLFPGKDSSGNTLLAYDRLFVDDSVNFRVGPMRLRQIRNKEESCSGINWENSTCFDKYSIFEEEDSDFCVGWENLPCVLGQNVYNMTSPAWTFISATKTWGLPVTGTHATYGGGGYIMEFVVNYNISRLLTRDLFKYVWIDRKTRAVFVEFTLYNADNNVFVYVSILSEFPITGGMTSRASIKPFRPYQHVGNIGLIVFILELILFVGMSLFAVRKCIFMCKNGKKRLKEFWNFLDVVIITLFFVCLAMYVGRWLMINSAMEKFETDKNKFVNFSHIAVWDESFNVVIAFLIYFTTFRIMRFLSYNDRINILGRVLLNVGYDLSGCFVMFSIVYMAFVIFGNLIFGRHLSTYKDLLVSSTTLINAIIGKNSINDLFSIEPVLGRVYYFLFVLLLLWILMTMLNATLNTGITTIRSRPLRSSYGFANLVANIWQDTVGIILASNGNTRTEKQLKNNGFELPYMLHKDDLEIDSTVNFEEKYYHASKQPIYCSH